MALPNMPAEQVRSTLQELEQAIYNHEQWAEALYGTLICRLAPDQRDMDVDAHRNCRFGQWYYRSGVVNLARHPGLAEIEITHERMHQHARTLLTSSVGRVPISIQDYGRFVAAMKNLYLEVATVRREFEDTLLNLDPLTGTPSRTGMLTKLREQRELAVRNVHPCTIVMMDVDHFKEVNDRYGHGVGDKVLVNLARYVMAHLRPYDTVFRYGGEEFLICLPDTTVATGLDIVERLRVELGALTHEAGDHGTFHVTGSFGLTLLDPILSVEQSIDRADKALYAAKAKGRNRVIAWDASMNEAPAKPTA